MDKTKCLTIEAMDKCQCEWCKQNREWREIALKQIIELEAMKIYNHALKEAGVVPR